MKFNKYIHRDTLRRLLSQEWNTSKMAEEMTGKDPEKDPISAVLNMVFNDQHKTMKKQIFALNDDTWYDEEVKEYLKSVVHLGFSIESQIPFVGHNGKDLTEEFLYLLFHKEWGILLKFDTYNKMVVNRSNIYYNWKPNEELRYYDGIVGDGHYKDGIWVGSNDCREAFKYKLLLLSEAGQFVVPWVKAPICNLTGYGEDRKKVDVLTAKRFQDFNEEVRSIISK